MGNFGVFYCFQLFMVEYQLANKLKVIFEIDSWFTSNSNEEVIIALDIYKPTNTLLYSLQNLMYNNNLNNSTKNIYNNNIFSAQ